MKTHFFTSLNRSKSVGLSRVHNERTFAHRSAFSCQRAHFQDLHILSTGSALSAFWQIERILLKRACE